MSFESLGLDQALVESVGRAGYHQPTPIQLQSIPAILNGRDLLAAAQTGTGKTAAFALPLLQQLSRPANAAGKARGPRAVILTPTRELAAQVAESFREYGGALSLRGVTVFGGVAYGPQAKAFARGVDYVVATPGRLLDHLRQNTVSFAGVQTLVLDEADRMLDMGFIHDIRRVIKAMPTQRQNLMFSATFSSDIRKLAQTLLDNPQEIDVAPRNAPAELVAQSLVMVAKGQKRALLSWLIGSRDWRQVLVFTRTKHGANRLCKQLEADGLPAAALHGNKSQGARTRSLAEFKAGRIRVLVATDIAARGIDIDALPHVINYELPNVPADYVHRIGRTGRAGSEGQALSLVSGDERVYLKDIQKLLGRTIPAFDVTGFELERDTAQPEARPARSSGKPKPKGNGGRGRPGKQGGSRGEGASAGRRDAGNESGAPSSRRKRRRRPGGRPQGNRSAR